MSPFIPAAQLLCLVMVIAVSAHPARSETFPSRPVKVIVKTAAGSALDVLDRIVNKELSRLWART